MLGLDAADWGNAVFATQAEELELMTDEGGAVLLVCDAMLIIDMHGIHSPETLENTECFGVLGTSINQC